MSLKELIEYIYKRILAVFSSAPPGTLPTTGILGLALLIFGYYRYNRSENRNTSQRGLTSSSSSSSQQRSSNNSSSSVGRDYTQTLVGSSQIYSPSSSSSSKNVVLGSQSLASQLNGVKKIVLVVQGTVLVERTAEEVEISTTIVPEAQELVKELSKYVEIYLVAHVLGDIGQAFVSTAIEAAGILGNKPGQIKPHRLLFCQKLEGKISFSRQIEPDIHIDGHPSTVKELKRFLPRLVLIHNGLDDQVLESLGPNVVLSESLVKFFPGFKPSTTVLEN
uniref:Peroxisome biogenesis protein 22 n=1 Tax=Polytomella parva TaxID=51329 RepID=A0A7S0VXT3_9CHLO